MKMGDGPFAAIVLSPAFAGFDDYRDLPWGLRPRLYAGTGSAG